ncbi:TIGR01777 family oxidoreductase [Brachybacterium sp. MASK1Z-5]|uniref:TIGR01777 family oxidoreductase n=1 Tax=Brachybacterium halotolerans TaxID=2795215 RepID=A0ABS1B8K5_9MICO|nr:TIGR01777 family oxidoreductase [Brachybacterium halotolerans]MBK0330984.1 TIGR01777 family oxidoreductase [Brachybacterium halotolerans]
MRIEARTPLDHPVDEVLAWHERHGALVRLTPPGMARIEDPDAGGLEVGRRVAVRLGPPLLPTGLSPRWELRHASREDRGSGATSVHSFVDAQVTGPFRTWRHQHEIAGTGSGSSEIRDRIDLELPGGIGSTGEAAGGGGADLTGGIGGLPAREVRRTIERMLAFRGAQLREDLAFHARYAGSPRLVVAIAGASGLIGTQLVALLRTGGHRVIRMVRGRAEGPDEIPWDPERGELDPADLEGVDAVVNLAGRPISTRFTARAEREILTSRVRGGDLIARTLARMKDGADGASAGPRVLVQASAIGAYGAQRPGEVLTEDDAFGDDVLARVCEEWEASSAPAARAGVRVVHLRTGIVLSDGGGALLPQIPMFLAGIGGRLAAPDAVLSWITLDDMTRAYAHALCTEDLEGPVNAVAPAPVTSREFARTLGRVLHRPALVPVPGFGPALLLGSEGAKELVRADQDVDASRLLGSGFDPAHTELEQALRHVLRRPMV